MLNSIQSAALAAAIAVTSLGTAPLGVQAAPVVAKPAAENGVVQVYHRSWHRPRVRCNANRAADRAWRMGLNRVRVTHVGSRTITVRARWRGNPVRVIFARAAGCPVIARY